MMNEPLAIGQKLPHFSLKGVDNNIHSVELYREYKLFLVVFGCNHCPYVQAYEERIKHIQEKYRDGMQVVNINSNDSIKYPEDSFSNMQKRATENSFNFPYLHDETQEIAKSFGATHTPEFFLFDQDRILVYHGKLDDNWKDASSAANFYLVDAINETLDGKKVSIPETFSIGCTIKWK